MLTKLLAGFALALVACAASAQTSYSGSGSSSGASAVAAPHQAQQANAGASVTYAPVTNVPADTTERVRYTGLPQNTPDMILGAYAGNASPDSCTGTRQFGVSVPGGSAGFGSAKQDPLCGFRRDADYRMRFANFEIALAQAHAGTSAEAQVLQAQLLRAQLHDVYMAHVDICQAEGGKLADCQAQAFSDVYDTPTQSQP